MNECVRHRAISRRNSALIAAGVGIVALGSLGFVAAERFGLLTWSVKTEINGVEVDSRQVTPDADGKASFTVNAGEGAADVQITQTSDGQKQITVDLSGGAESATVKSEPK